MIKTSELEILERNILPEKEKAFSLNDVVGMVT